MRLCVPRTGERWAVYGGRGGGGPRCGTREGKREKNEGKKKKKKEKEEKGRRDSSRTIANAWTRSTRCAEARTIPYLLAGSSLPRNRRLRAKLL